LCGNGYLFYRDHWDDCPGNEPRELAKKQASKNTIVIRLAMAESTATQDIIAHLASRNLHPTNEWLQAFFATARPNTPLPALKQTALFRLLATDITHTLERNVQPAFPKDMLNGNIRERQLSHPIIVQVLDIEDISTSRWSQVEALEAEERGEMTKGKQVIRVVQETDVQDGATDGSDQSQVNASAPMKRSSGPYKLLLQDSAGNTAYAIDMKRVEKVDMNLKIGAKLCLDNALVGRGLILLEPSTVEFLGGKLDDLYKTWKEGRKERLKAAAGIRERNVS
jgi:RecQ-mediated genome instability protein 1